jgi:hypothetical protein
MRFPSSDKIWEETNDKIQFLDTLPHNSLHFSVVISAKSWNWCGRNKDIIHNVFRTITTEEILSPLHHVNI